MVPAALMASLGRLHDEPGRPAVEALVIGGSAGSVAALGELLPGLPADFPPVLIVVHVLATSPNPLGPLFAPSCALRVANVEPGEPIERGALYFAPADYHLLVEPDRRCALSIEPPVHFSRPAIDVLFESAADVYGSALAAVILTGASSDGAQGLCAVHARGGLAAREQAQERAPLPGRVIADGAAQHRIAGLERVEHRARGGRPADLHGHLTVHLRERAQVVWKPHAHARGSRTRVLLRGGAAHGIVCTSTESTAGRCSAIACQLSPASADAYTCPPVVPT